MYKGVHVCVCMCVSVCVRARPFVYMYLVMHSWCEDSFVADLEIVSLRVSISWIP